MTIENRWQIEEEVKDMVKVEAMAKMANAVTMAQRGLISYNEMMEIIEQTNEAKKNADLKVSTQIWNGFWE